ncbi:hypothetical protein EC837_0542 [Pseudomonas protegens]|nr:hypothetical protein EC837_0542 [Pseudomonas protegens]
MRTTFAIQRLHDFVATLSMPEALINKVGDQPLGRYKAAPTMQLALCLITADTSHVDAVRWRPHWATDNRGRPAPWPTGRGSTADWVPE